ncbi:hypothetical protein PR202_gb09872 [Eleusine coracana subsp. coracana]|uniref:Uncharacterized protein n=1 Tax=Eleusine coracana subsp. coracana TaxID=191504 RepID=A0AAV5EII4_ELECO|nr:hypothetical protein PR202_gb09872 [Eleusine coracana subsp. coracana]
MDRPPYATKAYRAADLMSRVGAEHVTPGVAVRVPEPVASLPFLATPGASRRRRCAERPFSEEETSHPHHSSLIASRQTIRHFGMPNSLLLLHRMVWPSVHALSAPINAGHCAIKFSALGSCFFASSPPPSNPHAHAALSSPALLQVSTPATSIAPTRFSLITDHNLLLQSRGMFDGGTDASMLAADGYASVNNCSSQSNTVRTEEEQRNKGKDLFFCDLPDLGGFDDFETNMRSYGATDFLPRVDSLSC